MSYEIHARAKKQLRNGKVFRGRLEVFEVDPLPITDETQRLLNPKKYTGLAGRYACNYLYFESKMNN